MLVRPPYVSATFHPNQELNFSFEPKLSEYENERWESKRPKSEEIIQQLKTHNSVSQDPPPPQTIQN